MNKQEIKNRIEKLRKEIAHHRYLYHVLDKQEISEAALDSLKNELFKLEMQYPEFITFDSPTQRVAGKPLDKFKKINHSAPMMSLFDAFSEEDIKDWEKRLKKIAGERKFDYYCELKLDGLAIALRYEKGLLILGATRGDGKVGEDVTQNIRTFESVPLNLRTPSESELKKIGFNSGEIKNILDVVKNRVIEIRGEAVMTKKVFKELNLKYKRERKSLLANMRNGAAGSIRQLDSQLAAERKLEFYAYSVVTDLGFKTHEQEHELAKLLGLKVLKQNKFCKNLEEVYKVHRYWDKNRGKLPIDCDGLVVKINDLSLWPVLGVVGKGPRYIMAYKFAAEQVTSKIKEVVWQVGRTGILTPTAVLEPVSVGGVTVAHATLHNMDEIERLKLKIGDTVILERAGDVIPKIVKVLPKLRNGKEKKINIPTKCPICESEAKKVPGEVAYKCSNKNCYAVNLRKLYHWASKGAMDIEGLGPKIIEQLAQVGLVSDIADFYTLTEGDLKPLERFADKSADNLISAIQSKKELDLARFLYGLGIHHVGEETALLLAQRIIRPRRTSLGLANLVEEILKIKLEDINDIGPIVAKSIFNWFRDEKNIEILKKLENSGVVLKIQKQDKKMLKLAGKTFVLTGSLSGLTRGEAKAKIRELGGNISSAVSQKTDYVVLGENPGSKQEKAKKLGVEIINEADFVNLIQS